MNLVSRGAAEQLQCQINQCIPVPWKSQESSPPARETERQTETERRERERATNREIKRDRGKCNRTDKHVFFFMYLSFYLQMDALYPSDTTRLRKTCSSDAAGSPWLVCRKLVLRFCIAPAHLCRQALVCHIAESERDLGGCSKMWLLHLEDRSRRHEA